MLAIRQKQHKQSRVYSVGDISPHPPTNIVYLLLYALTKLSQTFTRRCSYCPWSCRHSTRLLLFFLEVCCVKLNPLTKMRSSRVKTKTVSEAHPTHPPIFLLPCHIPSRMWGMDEERIRGNINEEKCLPIPGLKLILSHFWRKPQHAVYNSACRHCWVVQQQD